MKEKIAIFDFCETIVDHQTGDAFVVFCIESRGGLRKFLLRQFFGRGLGGKIRKCLFPRASQKQALLYLLKGISSAEIAVLAKAYVNELKKSLISVVYDALLKKKEDGYKIWIVSGGYDVYLNEMFNGIVEQVVATGIEISGNVCTGRMSTELCMADNKVDALKKRGLIERIDSDLSYVFSDCESDIPLFELVKNRVAVVRSPGQEWVSRANCQELVWG